MTSGTALVASCIFGWTLLTLSFTDWRHYILPDPVVLFLLITGLVATSIIDRPSLMNHLIGASAGFASMVSIAFSYRLLREREGLGFGDAKLVAALGAWLSWQGLPSAILLASAFGLAVTGARSLTSSVPTWTDRLPFGSFLAAGAWLTWLYGPLIFG